MKRLIIAALLLIGVYTAGTQIHAVSADPDPAYCTALGCGPDPTPTPEEHP